MELFEDLGGAETGGAGQNAPEFTVSELSGAVRRVVEGEFGRVRVRGEVGRISRPASGHLYFDLKDANACLGAVVWRTSARTLTFRPEEGMEVVATGRITTFPASSKYQLVIESLAPAGVGALMAMLEKRRAALAAEGLFEAGRKRPLPFLPRVIGVITSPSGAVIRDILHRLRERFPRPVLVWPVTVQGERCAAEVAAAIRGFNALPPGGAVPRPDLIIVARGGGSLEDLWGFNEEIVVRAVAEGTIPLISAVGHETDTTLIDHVADRRAPTPTAAAEMAVPVRLDLLAAVAGLEERRRGALARGLGARAQRLRDIARALPRAEALVSERAQRLDGLGLRLPLALVALAAGRKLALSRPVGRLVPQILHVGVERRRQRLIRAEAALRPEALAARLHRLDERLRSLSGRLAQEGPRIARDERRSLEATAARLTQEGAWLAREERKKLDALVRTFATLGPQSVLARGYAIVRTAGGGIVTDAATAAGLAAMEVEFADGRVRVKPDRAGARRADKPDQGSLF